MGRTKRPDNWQVPIERLNLLLKNRQLSAYQLAGIVSKQTGIKQKTAHSSITNLLYGTAAHSSMWVVISRSLGIDLRFFNEDTEWTEGCLRAYLSWMQTDAGKQAVRHLTTQAIWTNKITGEQIDPATATQKQEDNAMTSSTKPNQQPSNRTYFSDLVAAAAPSIVDLAAQFEVAQKRLVAAAAEHKAAQEALETLRAQLTAAIKP